MGVKVKLRRVEQKVMIQMMSYWMKRLMTLKRVWNTS